jgi:hypothetical protein
MANGQEMRNETVYYDFQEEDYLWLAQKII